MFILGENSRVGSESIWLDLLCFAEMTSKMKRWYRNSSSLSFLIPMETRYLFFYCFSCSPYRPSIFFYTQCFFLQTCLQISWYCHVLPCDFYSADPVIQSFIHCVLQICLTSWLLTWSLLILSMIHVNNSISTLFIIHLLHKVYEVSAYRKAMSIHLPTCFIPKATQGILMKFVIGWEATLDIMRI